MNLSRITLLLLTLLSLGMLATLSAYASGKPVQAAPGIQYEQIGYWDTNRLNQVLKSDFPKFAELAVNYTPAKQGVTLYRVTYQSVIPEQNNRPITASGLLAIPDMKGNTFPLVSYQHGTVYSKQQVPSFPEQSPETQLMLAQFAGQGYIVIGADYFGMGTSQEPEGYGVKKSHQQATFDMLAASKVILQQMKLNTSRLFLSGWSQGGFVTMAFLEKLESTGIKVNAVATASAPVDMSVMMRGPLYLPRDMDANWINIVYILTSFAFENYYGVPGLARSVINDDYYDIARKVYERTPNNYDDVPKDLHKLIRKEYFDPVFFANSAYGKLVADSTAYRWLIQSTVRNYYGEKDEAFSALQGQLAAIYQQSIGSGNSNVNAISTGDTDHRGTYAKAVPEWKKWFDGQ